ncbi:hypothetical protein CCACVL1_25106 [Corchorus capsularis]|uniref:Uncharacterized protein n=1 Tax=Corchorus capsularis TaxID=210143 RepID=A0A1R3GLX1_COCAP|nr:hypothetical protein CCACVL1_25106 [Corchorus capsularis]
MGTLHAERNSHRPQATALAD